MKHEFGFIPVASSLLTESNLNQMLRDFRPALENIGGQLLTEKQINQAKPLVFLIPTGGTERKILDLLEQRHQKAPRQPALLITHPGNNSLPAGLEVMASLQQNHTKGRIFHLHDPNDQASLQEVQDVSHDLAVHLELTKSRIGIVGTPSDWLVASSPGPQIVRRTWGPEVVSISIDRMIENMDTADKSSIDFLVDELTGAALGIHEPAKKELADSARVYLALKQVVERYKVDAITLRCFDLVQLHLMTGCFALSHLNDAGIMAGCEGDLVSTIGMLWVNKLFDQIPWMANPAHIDQKTNRVLLAHCTVARNLVHKYRLRSHFESGLGMAIQGQLEHGPVTLLRIGGRSLNKIWLAEGNIIETSEVEYLCRTQATIELTDDSNVGELLKNPLGNHIVLINGHRADRLRRWWQLLIAD
ncbi:MAG: hypothetical protein ABIA75_00270 [Candidatus Neomarinimicrobiota bacterium]